MVWEPFTYVWYNAGAFFGIGVVLAIIIQFFIERVLGGLSSRTKTEVDDEIVRRSRGPIFLALLFFAGRITVSSYALTPYDDVIVSIFNTIMYLAIVWVVARVLDAIIDGWGKTWTKKTKSDVDDHILHLVGKASSIVIWIIGLLFILGTWGVEIAPLLASLGIAGLAIAFALQSTLGNIFGGISLILDKNLAIGDVIDVAGDGTKKGKVLDIGLRSTKIQTFDNETLIVPNGNLASSTFVNVAQPTRAARVVIPFSVAYGSDIEKVKKVVLKEIAKVPDLEDDREPSVKFLAMADSGLNFKAYFYVDDYTKKFASLDLANTLIYNALNKNRLEIPFPQMDVHLKRR